MKLPLMTALLLVTAPAVAQGVADNLETHVRTLESEVEVVMLLTDAGGRQRALDPWSSAQRVRPGAPGERVFWSNGPLARSQSRLRR